MPATPRPRGFTGASASSSRPSTNTPMSERQQMALLMQMTSSSNQSDITGHSPARSRDRNERGETALHVAAIKGEQDSVKKLLDQGMNPNVVDFAGWSPLHEACNHGHYNVALILIKAGANVNAKGLDDNTPLHDAATVGHLKLVKMLIEKGADHTIKNRKGKTACDVAVPPVYSFLQQAKESSNNRTSQQIKKGGGGGSSTIGGSNTDTKTKTLNEDNEDATCNSTSGGSGGANNANQSNVAGGGNAGGSGSNQNVNAANLNPKEDDDIYEFKTTPKDVIGNDDKTDCLLSGNSNISNPGANAQINSNNSANSSSSSSSSNNNNNNNTPSSGLTSGTSLNTKNLDKNNPDDKTGSDDSSGNLLTINSTNQTKRSHSDIENTEDTTFNITDDENKRKKRKESEGGKESVKTASGSRGIQSARQDKNTKVIGTAAKAIGLVSKSGQIDRKSPCASPKPASKSNDSDVELEIDSKSETFGSSGPKVPPLKIVIPPQNTTGDQDACIRNGKNASARNHPALPYVVASSNSGNDLNVEKENSTSRCTSPTESSTKSNDNEKQTKLGANSSAEERAQQRVLRSSHRSGGASGQSVDRGSNNSSPQLQSSSPSPAPPTTNAGSNSATNSQCATGSTPANESTNLTNAQQSSSSNTSSPIAQPQHNVDSDSSVRNAPSPVASSTTSTTVSQNTVELHPRKRKIRTNKEDTKTSQAQSSTSATSSSNDSEKESILKDEILSHDQPMTNCYQMFLNIRKQIERRQRNLFPVQPKPPQGFKDYLMNRGTYVLSGKTSEPVLNYPSNLAQPMKELYAVQEKERHKLKMQHVVEKEKLVLAVEQEILRVHGRAARALANQSLPFSVCTILKDEEVYNMITPEQEEKDRNARSRYNGRLFLSWLQDVDDKWEKIKEAMLFRHHNEVESLHAVQKMDWEWKMKELLLCEYKAKPVIDDLHVPIVHVSDDFDLLPA